MLEFIDVILIALFIEAVIDALKPIWMGGENKLTVNEYCLLYTSSKGAQRMAQYQITNRPAPIDFECNSDIILRTIQNAKNLLMCRMGEVPYDQMCIRDSH